VNTQVNTTFLHWALLQYCLEQLIIIPKQLSQNSFIYTR